jgi:CheY-like chemotaxis protein
MRVPVVDDASSLRFMLRLFLEESGVEVEEASSGAEALDRLGRARAPRIDAAVIDQRMPDMTGLEVAAELVDRGAHPRLFLFTSYLHPELEDEARGLGVTTVLKTDLRGLVASLSGARDMSA